MFRKLINLLSRERFEADIQEELEFHRSQTTGSFGNSSFQAAATDLRDLATRDASAGTRKDRTRGALVIAEVALTVALTLIGGQLLGSFIELLRVDPDSRPIEFSHPLSFPSPNATKLPNSGGGSTSDFLKRSAPFLE